MATRTRIYSQFVRLLKVLLPLIALGILSSLFLIADRIEPNTQLALSELDAGEVLTRPGITNPTFAGQTETGETIRLQAQIVEPDGSGAMFARGLFFSMTQTDGTTLDVTSAEGMIPAGSEPVEFAGGVMVATSTGLVVDASRLSAARDMSRFEAKGSVRATSPFGDFQSGGLVIERSIANDGSTSYRAIFNGGVKLVYNPQE
jgi:lipopolysaccharide export system protein LptC